MNMKKSLLVLSFVLLALTALVSFGSNKGCPECGMALVEKK